MGPKKFARENADSEIPCIIPCGGSLNAKHSEQSATIKPEKEKLHFMMPQPRNLSLHKKRVYKGLQMLQPIAIIVKRSAARLYTYGQVTGVHRPRWGPDQGCRCCNQNLGSELTNEGTHLGNHLRNLPK